MYKESDMYEVKRVNGQIKPIKKRGSKMKLIFMLAFLFSLICFNKQLFAEEKKNNSQKKDFFVTPEDLRIKYQKIHLALFAVEMNPKVFDGPHSGPGYCVEIDDSIITIGWFKKNKINAKRHISISSIILIDKLTYKDKLSNFIVYYKGPFGKTEYFFATGKHFTDGESTAELIIKTWKIYLSLQK